MDFGTVETAGAKGHVLAHSIRSGGINFKKGRVLSGDDIEALLEGGIDRIITATLSPDDVAEDQAADRLAKVLAGDHVKIGKAFTGRVNLFSDVSGVLRLDVASLERINRRHEAITVATLPAFESVAADQMLATIKIIPFAAPSVDLEACLEIARQAEAAIFVAPFHSKDVRLIQTRLEATSSKMLGKTTQVTADRLSEIGSYLGGETRCAHETRALSQEILKARQLGFDILLIAGASAITDRRDVLPSAIEAAGGTVHHFGMPVDPGNLILLGSLDGAPVLGLPGCARSPKLNGFDWVLRRLAADIEVTPNDIMGMGVGGLLTEIPTRPQPRGGKQTVISKKVAALVLAAGQSRRMGRDNKLLIEVDGEPMVRRAVDSALGSKADPVIVVTGHEQEEVAEVMDGLDVQFAHNPDFADGLSTSLKAGLAKLDHDVAGIIIVLGDMPAVSSGVLDRLIEAFNPVEGRAIVVPTHQGKRGNPVLFGAEFFDEMLKIAGDVGARHLIGQHDDRLVEIEFENPATHLDIDTPEALQAYRERAQ